MYYFKIYSCKILEKVFICPLFFLSREVRDSNSSGLNGEKRYSKAMAEDNWRNRAAPSEENESSSESKNQFR